MTNDKPRTLRAIRALQAIFVLSGACGLVYESVWAHYLKLFLGHAAYAQTVVLVVFVGGMAIGAALCGRYATRIANPLRTYAAVEFAIGVGGVAFHNVFVRATDWAYATLLPVACSAEGTCYASWALAAMLVLPQSVLLGTTFPLLVSGVMRAVAADAGRQVSLLYFLNSIGAVAGVLASTFVVIPVLGLPGATLSAGIGNIAIAIVVWEVARHARRVEVGALPSPQRATPHDLPGAVRLLLAVSALTGLSSFMYEIFWIRMLSLVLGASTHAFELMLASFILGLALGGWWIRARIDAIVDPWRFLGRVQVLMGLAAVATLPLYNHTFDLMALLLRSLAPTESGYVLFNIASAGIAMAVMLPATFLAGMTLPLITLLLLRTRVGERSIGFVYAANTSGAIAGVLIAVHVLMPIIGLRAGMLVAGAIDIVLGLVLFARARANRRSHWLDGLVAAAAIAGMLGIAIGATFDPNRLASGVFRDGRSRLPSDATVDFHVDGKTATVDVVRTPDGHIAIKTNGKTDAGAYIPPQPGMTGDEETMVLAAALPIAYRPDAKDIAIVGFGSGMTTAAVLGSPSVRRVDTIEIEPAMVEGARAFTSIVDPAYSDPRSEIVIDDAKAHFARSGRKYDVIISEPSNPWVSGVSSLFTTEFYRRVRGQLNDGGLMVQWVQVYEFNLDLLASIMGSLGDVFDDYAVYHVGRVDLVIIASAKGPLGEPKPDLFAATGIARRLEQLSIRNLSDIELRRISGRNPMDQFLGGYKLPHNSDYFPVVDSAAPQARFMRSTALSVFALTDAPVPVVEMLERRPLRLDAPPTEGGINERSIRAGAAHAYARYLIDAKSGDGKTPKGDSLLHESVVITRAVFVDCAPVETAKALWDRVVVAAAEMNPVLSPHDAVSLWRNLADRPCAKRLPDVERMWIDLFVAVGARDADRMAEIAQKLLDIPTNTQMQQVYLYNVALTGQLADKQFAAARSTWSRMEKALPPATLQQPWMQLQRKWAQEPF